MDILRDLGNERYCRQKVLQKEKKAAVIIQAAFRAYTARKRYREYEKQYKHSQERILAAMKIQMFYRSIKRAKQAELKKEERAIIKFEKHKFINFFTDYVIRFKYLKPRLRSLLKQLHKLLKTRRQQMVVSAAILIQYHVRKMLKRLKAKRDALKPKKTKK